MKNNLSNIKKSKYYLDKGECIAIPTETVYGLAGNAYSNKATLKIFKLKKRTKKNPLIVHYHNLKMLNNDCITNNQFFKLYKKFCPGPLTFVLKLKKNSKISKNVTNNKKTLAIRFPSHPLTKKLLKFLNYPLAAPSANISTKISPVSKEDVKEEFGNKIKFILDGSKSKIGLESTIISLTGKPKILRLGGVERTKINKVLKKNIKFGKKNQKITVPGQSKLHYSPGIPIKLNTKKSKPNEAFILIKKRKKSSINYYYLSKNKNLKQAAKNLYKILRLIKNKNYKSIVVEKIPKIGLGEAINDRLKRASGK
mgnify:CR=1 FL=1